MKHQRLGPEHVGEDTYRIVEATMMNNAKRICGYDWYNAARQAGVDLPNKMTMRNYGRECALAYIEERGSTITEACTVATRLMYHRAYDDARQYITNTGGTGRRRIQATTTLAETRTFQLQHWDDTEWFETCEAIQRLPFPDIDKQVVAWIALGYTQSDIARKTGIKRTTLAMRIPKILERLRRVWSTDESSPWATLPKPQTTAATV